MSTWTIWKYLVKKNYLISSAISVSSVKYGKNGDNGEKLDGHINDKGYLMWKKNLEWI